ncbi:MAG: hypothetical protein O2782_10840 [bacterium]|nr:hypothetical protein [bacterium]
MTPDQSEHYGEQGYVVVERARSRARPGTEFTDYDQWCRDWERALAAIPLPQRPRRQDGQTEPRRVETLQ